MKREDFETAKSLRKQIDKLSEEKRSLSSFFIHNKWGQMSAEVSVKGGCGSLPFKLTFSPDEIEQMIQRREDRINELEEAFAAIGSEGE